jgi:hypothetical protein
MNQYELKYTDGQGQEHTEFFEDMSEVRDFYRNRFSMDYTTMSFKSLKSGRTVE